MLAFTVKKYGILHLQILISRLKVSNILKALALNFYLPIFWHIQTFIQVPWEANWSISSCIHWQFQWDRSYKKHLGALTTAAVCLQLSWHFPDVLGRPALPHVLSVPGTLSNTSLRKDPTHSTSSVFSLHTQICSIPHVHSNDPHPGVLTWCFPGVVELTAQVLLSNL